MRIYCGDNIRILKKYVATNSVQLTVTSPPYDNLRVYNGFTWNFEAVARELWRVTKLGGVVVWVVGDQTKNGSESGTSFRQALFFMEIGFNLHDTMIFASDKPPLTHNRYEQRFEYMFVFSKGKPSVVNLLREPCKHAGKVSSKRTFRHEGKSTQLLHKVEAAYKAEKIKGNIWHFFTGHSNNGDSAAYVHVAVFPEALARDHILSWSNPGDLVLDPFVGSGTTGKCAKLLDRDFIGIDISREYVELTKKRIAGAR